MRVMTSRWKGSAAPALAACLLAACGPAEVAGPAATAPDSVRAVVLTPGPSASLPVNGSLAAQAAVLDSSGAPLIMPIRWRTTDSSVARVSASGLVTAWQLGEAIIIAEAGQRADSMLLAVRDSHSIIIDSLEAPPLIELDPGESVRVALVGIDAFGNRIFGPRATWRADNSAVATVTGEGWLTALTPGSTVLRASLHGRVATIPLHVVLQTPERLLISFDFEPGIPDYWVEAFDQAREWWEQIFTAALPPADYDIVAGSCHGLPAASGRGETGVRIFVTSKVLVARPAQAAGCRFRQGSDTSTAVVGHVMLGSQTITIPDDEINDPYLRGYRALLAAHEIGHTLGLARPLRVSHTDRYSGMWGLAGYRMVYPDGPAALLFNSDSHWDAAVSDIMSQRMNAEISAVSIGALLDRGYPVRMRYSLGLLLADAVSDRF